MTTGARYDGIADWYETEFQTAALAERGWDVTGADVSEDMLRRAEARGVYAVRADATTLPGIWRGSGVRGLGFLWRR